MTRWSLLGDGFAGLWRSLRRRPPGAGEFAYHGRSQLIAFLVVLVFTLPVEILLIEVLVPWELVRWVLLVLAIAGTAWAIGVILSVRTFPHRVTEDDVTFRYGALGTAAVPLDRIASVEHSRGAPPKGEGVILDLENETAWIAAGGQTGLTLRLREPINIWDGWSHRGPVRTLHVAADDPAALEAAVRGRLEPTDSPTERRIGRVITHPVSSSNRRACLERWTEDALPPLPPLEGDPRMVRYVRPAVGPDEVAERLAHFREHEPREFRIVEASGQAMGWMAYWNRVWNDEPVLEIGWAVDPAFQGIDLREPMLEAISAARAEGSFRFLLASPAVDNERANAVCRAAGFNLAETLDLPYAPEKFQTCNVWLRDLTAGG